MVLGSSGNCRRQGISTRRQPGAGRVCVASPFDASQHSLRRRKSDPHRRSQPAELAPTMSPTSRYWLERSSEILRLPANKNPAGSQSLHSITGPQTAEIEKTASGALIRRDDGFNLGANPSRAGEQAMLTRTTTLFRA